MKNVFRRISVIALALVILCCCAATAYATVLRDYTDKNFEGVITWADAWFENSGVGARIVFNDGLNDEDNGRVAHSFSSRIDYEFCTNEEGEKLLHSDYKLDYRAATGYFLTDVRPMVDNADNPLIAYYWGMYTADVKFEADVTIHNTDLYYRMDTLSLIDESPIE